MKEFRVFGPPGCLSENTEILLRRGKRNSGRPYPIAMLYYKFNRLPIPKKFGTQYPWRGNHPAMTLTLMDNLISYHTIEQIVDSGRKKTFTVTTDTGKQIRVTAEHPFRMPNGTKGTDAEGFKPLSRLRTGNHILCRADKTESTGRPARKKKTRKTIHSITYHPNAWQHVIAGKNYKRIHFARIVVEADMNKMSVEQFIKIIRTDEIAAKRLRYLPAGTAIHHINEDESDDHIENLLPTIKEWHDWFHGKQNVANFGNFSTVIEKIVSIEKFGIEQTYDMVMTAPFHNYVAQGFIVHNTGKTSALATKYVPGSIKKFGRDRVMITSFTRAAAREISTKRSRETGENIDVPQSQVGTLHQICYHALNQPTIIETTKSLIQDWNTAYPTSSLSAKSIRGSFDELYSDEKSGNEDNRGDLFLSTTNILRNRLVDEAKWSKEQQLFMKRWREFKQDHMAVDFTDLIEIALRDMPYAPGQPDVLYIDEAQDFTPLQLALCRSWGQQMRHIVLVGDDDQCIYRFTGASPEAFLNPPIDAKYKEILTQSWRVPLAVLECAMQLIHRIKDREPKTYLPRFDPTTKKPVIGQVIENVATWKEPKRLLDVIQESTAAQKTVMVLASCSYMLNPLKDLLIKNGIAFGNRYRKSRADWNPLENKSAKIIAAFMGNGIDGRYWNIPQFLMWAEHIKVDNEIGLKKKVGNKALLVLKDAVKDEVEGLHTARHVLGQIMGPSAIEKAMARDMNWFIDVLKGSYKDSIKYPIKVCAENGIEALENRPLLTIGTIHSVKGAEADHTVLFPDTSLLANKEYHLSKTGGREAILRVFYVGITRAKETLTLCTPGINKRFIIRPEEQHIKFKLREKK